MRYGVVIIIKEISKNESRRFFFRVILQNFNEASIASVL